MTRKRTFLLAGCPAVVLLAMLLALPTIAARAAPQHQVPYPDGEARYFEDTQHVVRGPFLDFFDTRGGLRIFGYPQTALFYDSDAGLWVQYFDYARMEWHPENPDPYRVQLSLLGDILGHSQPPGSGLPRSSLDTSGRVFEETGQWVPGGFLQFFNQNGGLEIFGYPVSAQHEERGFLVQYFQRMRMEWHPERPRSSQVVLGTLGLEALQQLPVPPRGLRPERRDALMSMEPSAAPLRVWVGVRDAVTTQDALQTIVVYATDPGGTPVADATVTVVLHYPSGAVLYSFTQTDQQGISLASLLIQPTDPGRRVVVEAIVEHSGARVEVETFFTPWW
jgi:hypothetical protein